jgi:cytoskeletal protein CcmA (bactofilin family)
MSFFNPLSTKQRPTAIKKVACSHCKVMSEFPRRAMSAFCPHCQKRLVLEDLTIRGYHTAREIATCGDMVVERRGHVVGSIRVANLIVHGKVDGKVSAGNRINVTRTGLLTGDIEASYLEIESGAQLNCRVHIGSDEGRGDGARVAASEAHTAREAPRVGAPAPVVRGPG